MPVYAGATNEHGAKWACIVASLDASVVLHYLFRPRGHLSRKEERRLVSAINAVQLFARKVARGSR